MLPISPKILEARPAIVARFLKFSGGNHEPKQQAETSSSSENHNKTKRKKKEGANHHRAKHDHQMDLKVLSDTKTHRLSQSHSPSAEICEEVKTVA